MGDRAVYIMIGGFLGAGKTTAILKLGEHLTQQGRKVGLITNDQSVGLVDTALAGSQGFPVEEITGGCFCCKFNSLVDASDRLSRLTRPDVFIAEPVGSCTDLKATVHYPLRRIYGDAYRIAPFSVLIDPTRALRILGLEAGKPFSNKVLYVYRKQLEEAEYLIINKSDLLTAERLQQLQSALSAHYPASEQFVVSARHGSGLQPWFARLSAEELGSAAPPEIDYDLYAEGEALLGWLNGTLRVAAGSAFDGNAALTDLARRIQRNLTGQGLEIAHLKMILTPAEEGGDLGVCNLVRSDGIPEQSHRLKEPLEAGELILNLRAEGDPEVLRSAVDGALREWAEQSGGLQFEIEHIEQFRPGRPVPTHRVKN